MAQVKVLTYKEKLITTFMGIGYRMGAPQLFPQNDPLWDRLVGSAWSQLFGVNGVDPSGVVAEVGPGFTLKVVHGLQAYGFQGTFRIIEPNDAARQWVFERCRDLLPGVTIDLNRMGLGSQRSSLIGQVDALVMNHLLDDLILEAVLDNDQTTSVFGGMWKGTPCHDAVKDAWMSLQKNKCVFENICQAVFEKICSFVSDINPRLFVANQYPSWFQRCHGLDFVNDMTAPLLSQLARRLERRSPRALISLRGFGAMENCWLVMHNPGERSRPPGEMYSLQ